MTLIERWVCKICVARYGPVKDPKRWPKANDDSAIERHMWKVHELAVRHEGEDHEAARERSRRVYGLPDDRHDRWGKE